MRINKLNESKTKLVEEEQKEVVVNLESKPENLSNEDEIKVENKLTKALDRCYKAYKENKSTYGKSNANLLVIGLPGSSKTASVEGWARQHGFNFFPIDARGDSLNMATSGTYIVSKKSGEENSLVKATSKDLQMLDRPNSILFIDEFNRQMDVGMRSTLFDLINNKRVITTDKDYANAGRDGEYYHYFKDLMFTVVCINPKDEGSTDLIDPEKDRFLCTVRFNSNKNSAASFYGPYFKSRVKRAVRELDKNHTSLEVIDKILLKSDLAAYIVSNPDFWFTGEDDNHKYDAIMQDANVENMTRILTQRGLTEAIDSFGQDVEDFKEWVADYSNLAKKEKENLLDILSSYVPKGIDLLRMDAGINPKDYEGDGLEAAEAENTQASQNQQTQTSVPQGVADEEKKAFGTSELSDKKPLTRDELKNKFKNLRQNRI